MRNTQRARHGTDENGDGDKKGMKNGKTKKQTTSNIERQINENTEHNKGTQHQL